jgi:hypothetical protein
MFVRLLPTGVVVSVFVDVCAGWLTVETVLVAGDSEEVVVWLLLIVDVVVTTVVGGCSLVTIKVALV